MKRGVSRGKLKEERKVSDHHAPRILVAALVGVTLFLAGLMHLLATSRQYRSITRTIEQWKPIYGLDESQALAIREIELNFHGNGSPFLFRGKRTPDQVLEHHKQISKVMKPESGARFLADMEGERHWY